MFHQLREGRGGGGAGGEERNSSIELHSIPRAGGWEDPLLARLGQEEDRREKNGPCLGPG